jgi:hypothetical protein
VKQEEYETGFCLNRKNINHFCKSKNSARSKKIVKDNTKMNNVKEKEEEGRGREAYLGMPLGWALDFEKFGRRREGGCWRVRRLMELKEVGERIE